MIITICIYIVFKQNDEWRDSCCKVDSFGLPIFANRLDTNTGGINR